MGYEKSNWKKYGDNIEGYRIKLIIEEISGVKVGNFIAYSNKQYQQILRNIKNKYGYSYPIESKIPITMVAANIIHGDLNLPFKKGELTEQQKEDKKMLEEIGNES